MNKAVIVTYPDDKTIEEAYALAEAADYVPVSTVTQDYLSRSRYGVGSGKAEELAETVRAMGADLIFFDERLGATQTYNLARLCGVEVKDREKIILEIFQKRAATAEAKLQVQLAELEYELPRARDKVRMAKKGEQPGFFGLGKYEIDVYTRMMKARIGTLHRKVGDVARRRRVLRRRRARQVFPSVALAGYTAAGKTSLFNKLTGEMKEVDAGVFTTLASTTRFIMIDGRKCLLTDTVGFISNLPTYLVDSFRSTLEDVSDAEVVLLIIDVSQSEEKLLRSYRSSMQVLADLEVHPERTVLVLSKADLVDEEKVEERKQMLGIVDSVTVSSTTGDGLESLFEAISSRLEGEPPSTEAAEIGA